MIATLVRSIAAESPRAPINTLNDLEAALLDCWVPPPIEQSRPGMQITVLMASNATASCSDSRGSYFNRATHRTWSARRIKGDPGPAPAIRVVTGTDSVRCGDDEVLAGFVCASGATDGAKCATPGTASTGLCVRR